MLPSFRTTQLADRCRHCWPHLYCYQPAEAGFADTCRAAVPGSNRAWRGSTDCSPAREDRSVLVPTKARCQVHKTGVAVSSRGIDAGLDVSDRDIYVGKRSVGAWHVAGSLSMTDALAIEVVVVVLEELPPLQPAITTASRATSKQLSIEFRKTILRIDANGIFLALFMGLFLCSCGSCWECLNRS